MLLLIHALNFSPQHSQSFFSLSSQAIAGVAAVNSIDSTALVLAFAPTVNSQLTNLSYLCSLPSLGMDHIENTISSGFSIIACVSIATILVYLAVT
jgi:hypothetical protein